MQITPATARRLAISRQHLAAPQPAPDAAGLWQVIRDLRCLQLDPISAVARSHLLVLWSRVGAFAPATLDQLVWGEQRLWEYWAHCASLVLTEDFALHQSLMIAHRTGTAGRGWQWMDERRALHDHVVERLQREGPLGAGAFEVGERNPGRWSSGRDVNGMLEWLWLAGEVLVAGRSATARVWDVPERVLPPSAFTAPLAEDDATRRAAALSLRALGVARTPHIQQHFIRGRYPRLAALLNEMERDGEVIRVEIVDGDQRWPGPWWLHREDMALVEAITAGNWTGRTVLLSPFDNLICDRARTQVLWDFHFRIEIYVPAAKRQYGYYVLPILHHDRLIGRLDPHFDRKTRRLQINAVYAEATAPSDAATVQGIAATVRDLAAWLGATEVVWGRVPEQWAGVIHEDGAWGQV